MMIHETTMIYWMDVKNGKVMHDTVANMFKEFSYRIEDNIVSLMGIEREVFDRNQVKITDLYGWADMICIEKQEYSTPDGWLEITAGGNHVIVNEYTLIPIFKPDEAYEGFHGEVKYPYVLKHPEKILPDDLVRLKRGKEDVEFSTISIKKFNHPSNIGYDIKTNSRFFNANDIYILGDNFITNKEALAWDKYK